MIKRIITASILIPMVVLLVLYSPPLVFQLAISLIFALAAWEWTQFFSRNVYIRSVVWIIGCASVYLSLQIGALLLYLAAVWWSLAILALLLYPNYKNIWQTKAVLFVVGVLLFAPAFYAANSIRATYSSLSGPQLLLFLLVLVWLADSAAFFSGKFFGKKKFIPAVSPNKTWVGMFGAVIATSALILSGFCFGYLSSQLAVICFIAVLYSILGDLVESMFKRSHGIKDSGNLLPGHGGFLDRIDSILSALPIFALGLLEVVE